MMAIIVKHKGLRFDDFDDTFYDDEHKFVIDKEANLEQYLSAIFEALRCEGFSENLLTEYKRKLDIE